MNKNIAPIFTRIVFILFAIATILILLIAYKGVDIDRSIAFKFGIGYVFLTFFLLIYIPLMTIFNSKKMKWVEIKKRLIKFTALFILFSALNWILDIVFRESNIELFRMFSSAAALAFGISFIDVILLKKKEN